MKTSFSACAQKSLIAPGTACAGTTDDRYGPASFHHLTKKGLKVDAGTRHQAWEIEIRPRGKYDDKGWN